MLATLYQKGYPVPDGFVVLPTAFDADALIPASVSEIRQALAGLRRQTPHTRFAVRSSALSGENRFMNARTPFVTSIA